ncbi:YybH family protein [Streptomyces sp. NPDC057236]|uniref:YybH family protein n=1 Tax=Streptomyces sp. NPDC057236 TaxID=3346059 RepID=UPI00362B06FD
MPDDTISARNSAQQLLGLTPRTPPVNGLRGSACSQPARPQRRKEKEKNTTPEVVHERFAQYLKDQDLDGLGSLFDEHAMFVPGQQPVYGRESVKEVLKPYFASPSTMEVVATSVHQNGDLAMVQPSWRITSESGTVEGKAVEVMRRTSEGDWVYIIDNPYGV